VSETDVVPVLSAWPIGPVHAIANLGSDSNNDNWLIEASTGAYVLRGYRNITAEAHIAFEHALLQAGLAELTDLQHWLDGKGGTILAEQAQSSSAASSPPRGAQEAPRRRPANMASNSGDHR